MNEERQHKTSLLDQLRPNPNVECLEERLKRLTLYNVTGEEARKKMFLMIQHQAEFPSKLRPSIAAVGIFTDPVAFLSQFYNEVKGFILGRSIDPKGNIILSKKWQGLDSNVDTEEEVELLIRLFPKLVLHERHARFCTFQEMIMISVQTVRFVPLFAKLHVEFSNYGNVSWTGVFPFLGRNLLCGFPAKYCDSTALNDASFDVLVRLIEEKRIPKINAFFQMDELLKTIEQRDIAFIETRIRFLIQWVKFVLTGQKARVSCRSRHPNGRKGSERLLRYFLSMDGTKNDSRYLRVFEVLVELGMFHYTKALGFVFHGDNLGYACYHFGEERVKQIVHEKLASVALKEYCKGGRKKRKDFVTDNSKFWSADAIYMVLRHDPIGVLYY